MISNAAGPATMSRQRDRQKRRAWTAAAMMIALSLAMTPAIAAQVIDRAAARRAVADPGTVAAGAQLAAFARNGAVDALAAELQSLASDRRMDPVAREWLLDRGLQELAPLAPTPKARSVVETLKARGPAIFVPADPDHGGFAVPLFDIGATARFVLNCWQRAAAREETRAALLAGRTSAVGRFALQSGLAERDPTRAGIADAYATVLIRALASQRPAVVAAITRGDRVDELALVIAERTADRELLDLVIGYADPAIALVAVAVAARVFDPGSALKTLVAASHRPEIASAALLEIGRLAAQDGAARDHLYEAIQDPLAGPSAAAALASLKDPAIASELGQRLRLTKAESSRRMLVLALKLDGTAAARGELQRFAGTGAGSLQLRKEVREWLAH